MTLTRFIARPWMSADRYPWRPMDNRERRARWAVLYYLLHQPYEHPAKGDDDEIRKVRID